MKVFLSHSHADAPLAAKVTEALRTRGLDVWDPDAQLLPGDNWAAEIARALEQSQAMVVLLTPQAVQSRHVMREIEYALGAKSYSHRLIPVVVGDRSRIPEHEIPWIVRRLPWLRLNTIFGNVHTELATRNALRLLSIAGRGDIPVAHGADDPLTGDFEGPVPYVHGEDGQGDIFLPDPAGAPLDLSAAEFIIEQLRAKPGEITLVPVGPLTNIALALRLEPRITEWVDEVVLMGGNALVPGNASPAGEANIRNDPEAADLVFGADWAVTMVGLDVTLRVHMTPAHITEYATHGNPMSDHITRILPHY
ncbi:MAG: nucleoside hydrolase, partial [Rhodospirillales bacterium]|nr:nucleoside hydrolase [Rhodospirillales bacterium]